MAKDAVPLSDYLLDNLETQTDMGTREGRARLVSLAKPLLARLPQGVFRGMLKEELGRRAQVNAGNLDIPNPAPSPENDAPRPQGRPQLNSPVRKAIGYLLLKPALAAKAGSGDALQGADIKGIEVLQALLEFCREHPHINGAGVLEHWRDTETGATLDRLAQADIVTPEAAWESEFLALMADLTARRPAARRLDELISESRRRPLEPAEKVELTQLLAGQGGQAKAAEEPKSD
jgi:DNA primase